MRTLHDPRTLINPQTANEPETDTRPRFGIGHILVSARSVDTLADFYAEIGMRLVVKMGRMAIVELRGGTHIVFQSGRPGEATLDLIVDDIDETRALLEAVGANPGRITRGNPHDRFTATDPEGNHLVVASNHAIGVV